MDALLTAHRSLSARCVRDDDDVRVLRHEPDGGDLLALGGAWPVLGLLVIDVVLPTLAFRMNFRAGRMFKRVRVDGDCLHFMRQPVRARASHWVVNPAWARAEDLPDVVRIAAGDRAVHVGRVLSPPERTDLAAALGAALAQARRGGSQAKHILHRVESGRLLRRP